MSATTLNQVEATFTRLGKGPNPMAVKADLIGDDRDHPIAVTALARYLLDPTTTVTTRDAAWAHVVHQARVNAGTWMVAAAGLALPGLRRAANRVRHVWPHADPDDIECEVLSGFLSAMATIDLDEPHICSRLCQKAFLAGRHWARSHMYTAIATQRMYESHTPPRVYGHPDLVIATAVREGIITQTEAHLIIATRLEKETLAKTAAEFGCSVAEVRIQRKHGEAALTEWITD